MASVSGPGFLHSIRNAIDPSSVDPTLVENTPRLLDILNRSDRLARLLGRRDARGYTLLHLAAEKNQPESLKCLLIKEANPNVVSTSNSHEVTPLHVAAGLGHLACLQLLVQSGGDVLYPDNQHRTPLDYAVLNGQDLCLNFLNEEIAKRQSVEAEEVKDVLVAVEQNLAVDNLATLTHWQLFDDLFPLSVSAGSNPTPTESLLYRRCEVNNSQELVRVFNRLSKDIPFRLHDASLLHSAARYGQTNLVHLLTEHVPPMALAVSSEGYNALHVAIVHHHVDVAKLLIEKQIKWAQRSRNLTSSQAMPGGIEGSGRGGSTEVNSSYRVAQFASATVSGHTVLHFAVAVNNIEGLFYLLKYHRELQLPVDCSDCGYTPLHLAVFLNNRLDIIKMLLHKGANPNTRIDQGVANSLNICRTPLAEAALNKNVQVVNCLLEAGAEDKQHEAIKKCVPYNRHSDLVLPILGSLVKHDGTYKPSPKDHRNSRHSKHVALEWAGLSLTEFLPHWLLGALSKAASLRSVEISRHAECVTTVNLSGNQLQSVPAELFHLPRVHVINLSGNQLEGLPELDLVFDRYYQWPCASLTKFNLSKNRLRSLPEFIFSLPNLVHLDLSQNLLRELPLELWKAPRLHTLLCQNNELEAIPTNWPHVLNIFTKVQNPSPKHMEAPQLRRNRSITKLKAGANKEGTGTSGEKGDTPTKEDEQDKDDAPLISKLHDRLNVSNAHLPVDWAGSEGREEVYEGLAILNLAHNHIQEIPENFPCLCPKLVRLDLSYNSISSISLPRSFPQELKQINLSYNEELEAIDCRNTMAKPLPCTNPQVLAEAQDTLYMDDVSFCVHRSHQHMGRLLVLEVTHCSLLTVNFFCPGPRSKQASGTKKSTPYGKIDTMIGATAKPRQDPVAHSRLVCPLLTRLILNNNQLTKVPESVCEMTSLNSLDLSHNDIIDLPAEMGNLNNLWEFPLAGLKLISPPQNIIERGKTKDIIGFLWSLLQRARPYHRMKLMLVGRADRGKTTLLTKISEKGQRGVKDNWGNTRMRGSSKNISTVGIVVSDWTYFKRVRESQTALKSITFMTWDFGGQEEYYATHQCFLSRRSLYLAVWNVTHGMRGVDELKPWLLNIQARAPNSPVIIVGTHLDKLGRSGKQELLQCQDYINNHYGNIIARKEGFPQIMGNIVVSCTSGRNIGELRDIIFDVASQVRENTVAGRGIGHGSRIAEYRLLMDQLVPASYLQLEDTVRNIALNMRLAGNPPVLNYKKLRNEVFADPRTLISKDSGNRELEQAVRFLHDNGTMLHFEDPLLNDFYFVDPQWLCDMLAHIVTVREINPFVRDGVMRILDFPLIFNDMEFPIRWKAEYIRLLTTFEVAVELGEDQLLIPSALPQHRPNLPQPGIPDEMKRLPPLRHTYIVPFIPSGFWPRLMSRLLMDTSIMQLARDGCAVPEEESDQLNWVKWRTGMLLQYGNLTILSVQDLSEGMFPGDPKPGTGSTMYRIPLSPGARGGAATRRGEEPKGIMVFAEEQWQEHNSASRVYGIDIQAPDIYPILKFPEVRMKYKKVNSVRSRRGQRSGGEGSGSSGSGVEIHVQEPTERGEGSSNGQVTNRMVSIDQIDSEFEKLRIKFDISRSSSSNQLAKGGGGGDEGGSSGRVSPAMRGRGHGGTSQHPNNWGPVAPPFFKPTPQPPVLNTVHAWLPNHRPTRTPSDPPLPQPTKPHPHTPPPTHVQSLRVTEEKNDIMRAGLLSKTIDHITLLIEDYFQGVRPRTLIVPCPHCSEGTRPPVRMMRSYSEVLELLPAAERVEREAEEGEGSGSVSRTSSVLLRTGEEHTENGHPHASMTVGDVEGYHYAYRYNDCVVAARKYNSMYCPIHGELPLQFMAPDTLFLTQGQDILVSSKDLERKEQIGRGAFATVFRANYKNGQEVALKAMTKEWRNEEAESHGRRGEELEEGEGPDPRNLLVRPPSRHSIVTGFTNVKKELSILSPLSHPHVVHLYGVMLRPMGLILEYAPRGSLKKILTHYQEVHSRPHLRAMQRVLLQVASAIQYLHSCSIIYRDLKSDNVLVWRFPEPQDPIPISLGQDMGGASVLVKLSDYGISQFVASQGAKGLMGTAGFIAPEILKYHGKEVYDQQVDLFSFGMFLYELLTLHIPFESLPIQQANQANERGTRPSLSRRDFPCPVLVRELMVWCWQQFPDHRPSAGDIITMATKEQFPRMLDAIRVCNSGQVTATCLSVVNCGSSHQLQRRESRLTPPPSLGGGMVSEEWLPQDSSSLPQLEVVTEENRGSDSVFEPPLSRGSGRNSSPRDQEGKTTSQPPGRGSSGSGERGSYGRQLSSQLPHSHSSFLQRQLSSDELALKRASPGVYSIGEEDVPVCEVWVASSNARHSTISVMDYAQRFTGVEDVEVGDSAVLSLCLVRRKVWMGMAMGCLVVYDANTRKPYLQAWIKHYKKIQAISHLPALRLVYLGLDDGSVLAYHDDLPSQPLVSLDPTLTTPPLVALTPVATYRDSTQSSSCILPLPRHVQGVESATPRDISYELWVGQKGNWITVLDAASLGVVKFLKNPFDRSEMPSFVAYMTCSHLVYGCHSVAMKGRSGKGEGQGVEYGMTTSVYSSLYHGQYVTRWETDTHQPVDSLDCRTHSEDKECSISSLLFSRQELCIGLTSGLILVLDPVTFSVLCTLSGHRGAISSLLALDFSGHAHSHSHTPIQPTTTPSSSSITGGGGVGPGRDAGSTHSHSSAPSPGFCNGEVPSPINMASTYRLSPLSSVVTSSVRCGERLMSFGSGFKSYYDAPDCSSHHNSGFLLVWDAEDWPASRHS